MTVNTTWVSPVSATLDKTTGNTIDETMTDAWSSDLYHLGGTAGYIGCRAGMSGTQSLSNGSSTAVGFGLELFDSDPNGAMHDNSTNNSRITCRTAGVYRITAYVQFAANSTGVRQLKIRLNGASDLCSDTRAAAASPDVTEITIATDYLLSASDYVEAMAYQSSGGALNASAGALTMVKA